MSIDVLTPLADGSIACQHVEETPVRVIFRVWRQKPQNVIALFPDEDFDGRGHCSSYEHIGQHGAADFFGVLRPSRLPTPEEYAPLQRELEQIGYRLIIRKRHTPTR